MVPHSCYGCWYDCSLVGRRTSPRSASLLRSIVPSPLPPPAGFGTAHETNQRKQEKLTLQSHSPVRRDGKSQDKSYNSDGKQLRACAADIAAAAPRSNCRRCVMLGSLSRSLWFWGLGTRPTNACERSLRQTAGNCAARWAPIRLLCV